MKKKIIVISLICICLLTALCTFFIIRANSKPSIKNYGIFHDEKFGGVYVDISIEDFNNIGFEFGDSVSVNFSNGYTIDDLPYYNGYYVDTGEKLVVGYPGYEYLKIGINYGDDLYQLANLDENSKVTIKLKEKAKYIKDQIARDIHYSDEQGNKSDEVFANFRSVNVGNLKQDIFYRSASPCDNTHNRAAVVDRLIKDANVKYIVNLSDGDEEIKGHIAKDDFNSPYFLSLYNNNNVIALSMSMQFKSDDFATKLIQGLNAIFQNEEPFLVHCVEGKDRTGFVCMIIEALAGASYNEIIDDYMLTYANYYDITKETDIERYNIIKEKNIDTMLKYVAKVDENTDLSTLNYEKCVEEFLISKGMTTEEIVRLKEKITN